MTEPTDQQTTQPPGQPDGIEDDSRDLPDPQRAAERVRAYIEATGDGLYDAQDGAPLYGRDLEAICRAVLSAGQLREQLVALREQIAAQALIEEYIGESCRNASHNLRRLLAGNDPRPDAEAWELDYRALLAETTPSASVPSRRAQEPASAPAMGEFCHQHYSWLCQAGQGKCQARSAQEADGSQP